MIADDEGTLLGRKVFHSYGPDAVEDPQEYMEPGAEEILQQSAQGEKTDQERRDENNEQFLFERSSQDSWKERRETR